MLDTIPDLWELKSMMIARNIDEAHKYLRSSLLLLDLL